MTGTRPSTAVAKEMSTAMHACKNKPERKEMGKQQKQKKQINKENPTTLNKLITNSDKQPNKDKKRIRNRKAEFKGKKKVIK